VRRPAFLTAPEAAEYLRCTLRSLHGRTSVERVPYRRLGGMRRLLFLEDELRQFVETGGACELEVLKTPDGGKVVRPKLNGATSNGVLQRGHARDPVGYVIGALKRELEVRGL
jgi:hypothetical protein